jgi:hypothetical protein
MRALENTMPIIKEATYNFLVKFSGKDEMKKDWHNARVISV